MSFDAIDEMERRVGGVAEAHVVEDEKLGLRPEERSVRDAGALQIRFCFFRDAARIAVVRLARDRIDNRANQTQCRFGIEDIDPRRRRIRNHEHVGRIDDFPAANARAVETEPFRKNIVVIFGERRREMLPGAGQIGELEIDEFHVVVFDHFADIGWSFSVGHVCVEEVDVLRAEEIGWLNR